MASSPQQEPHLTIREQSESRWQVLHESGTARSLAAATTEIMAAAVMNAASGGSFFCIDPTECTAGTPYAAFLRRLRAVS